jgi:hypothetical protein
MVPVTFTWFWSKITWKDSPLESEPESQRPSDVHDVPLVEVCPALPALNHTTVSPTATVTSLGLKKLFWTWTIFRVELPFGEDMGVPESSEHPVRPISVKTASASLIKTLS